MSVFDPPINARVNEKCSCGATFTASFAFSDTALRATSRWRREHACTNPPAAGRCGDPSDTHGGTFKPEFCRLTAGHDGWHRSDSCEWGYPRWNAPSAHRTPPTTPEQSEEQM